MSNCKREVAEVEGMNITCNATRVIIKPKDSKAIGDTGTTGHFIKPGAPVDEVRVAENPIEI